MTRRLIFVALVGFAIGASLLIGQESQLGEPVVDQALDKSVPQMQLSATDEEELAKAIPGMVPWGYIHRWFTQGNYEAIARAFEGANREDCLRRFGAGLQGRGKSESLHCYLQKYYPDLAEVLGAGVAERMAQDDEVALVRITNADTDDGWSMLASTAEISTNPRARSMAVRRLIETGSDEKLEPYLAELLPRLAIEDNRLATACMGKLLVSDREWARNFATRYVLDEQPGWDLLLTAALAKRDQQEYDWLLEIQTNCSEAAREVVDITVDTVAVALGLMEWPVQLELLPSEEE